MTWLRCMSPFSGTRVIEWLYMQVKGSAQSCIFSTLAAAASRARCSIFFNFFELFGRAPTAGAAILPAAFLLSFFILATARRFCSLVAPRLRLMIGGTIEHDCGLSSTTLVLDVLVASPHKTRKQKVRLCFA
jgi:hypothetical protein